MGNRRGLPRMGSARAGGEAGRGRNGSDNGAAGEQDAPDDVGPSKADSPPRSRRKRPWLRVFFLLFLAVEGMTLLLIDTYAPVYQFEITSVTVTGESGVTTVIGNNPDLSYPITLGGSTCRLSDLATCVTVEPTSEALASVCCTELLNPSSSGPEELISWVEVFAYVVVIPVLILLVRGFLLGRLWTLRQARNLPFCMRGAQSESAWGKRRWHLRVGFFALDAVLGLLTAVVTASLFATVAKVTCGRPRPNYYALRFYTEHTLNGQDFNDWSITSWPSGHAATAMAGLVFLAYVLWRDLSALVTWRRRAHPKMSLVLAVLGGFVVAVLPMLAILVGITQIREYWHRPDDVLVGSVIGLAAAHWSFQFVVLMPFRHEIGSPEWSMDPKWLKDEELQWEEDEELRLCGWRRASGRNKSKERREREKEKRAPWGAGRQAGADPRKAPTRQVMPPVRVAPDEAIGKVDYTPV